MRYTLHLLIKLGNLLFRRSHHIVIY